MSEDELAPEQVPDTPATPDEGQVATPEPAEFDPTAVEFSDKFDPKQLPEELQPAWRQMHGKFTQTQQQLGEQRREAESALQWWTALNSEDQAQQRFAFQQIASQLGYELPDIEDDNAEFDPSDTAPEPPSDPEMEAIKEHYRMQQAQQVEDGLKQQVDTIAQELGHTVSDAKREVIVDLALVTYEKGGGVDVRGAYDRVSGVTEAELKAYRDVKRNANSAAPPVKGSSGVPEPAGNDRDSRLAYANLVANEAYGQ